MRNFRSNWIDRSICLVIALLTPTMAAGQNDAAISTTNRQITQTPNQAGVQAQTVSATIVDQTDQPLEAISPTIIIRPPQSGATGLNDCVVEIDKIDDRPTNDYAIKLFIPDNVQVIEVVPTQSGTSKRSFKIRLDQTGTAPPRDDVALLRPLPLEGLLPRTALPPIVAAPTAHPPAPSEAAWQGRQGFQTNPFFETREAKRIEPDGRRKNLSQNSERGTGAVQFSFRSPVDADRDPEPQRAVVQASAAMGQDPDEYLVAHDSLRTELLGPRSIDINQSGEYAIRVTNDTLRTLNAIQIQLAAPSELEVAVLDDLADIDPVQRKIMWSIDELGPDESTLIRYRVQSNLPGEYQQSVAVSADAGFDRTTEIEMVVLPTTNDVSSLPYEKEAHRLN